MSERLAQLHGEVHASFEVPFTSTLRDLQQLRSLLMDATGKLSRAFQLVVRQAREQGVLAARLQEETDAPSATAINDLAREISRGAGLVVQSLQFEDMATQLPQHVDKRLAWLDEFSRDASVLRADVQGDVVGMTFPEFLDVSGRIADLNARVGTWDRKPVQQQSLDEGDIELFQPSVRLEFPPIEAPANW
jgi:hypothetical protein